MIADEKLATHDARSTLFLIFTRSKRKKDQRKKKIEFVIILHNCFFSLLLQHTDVSRNHNPAAYEGTKIDVTAAFLEWSVLLLIDIIRAAQQQSAQRNYHNISLLLLFLLRYLKTTHWPSFCLHCIANVLDLLVLVAYFTTCVTAVSGNG